MLSEVGGSCTYDAMIKMFEAKMSGGPNDPDDLIVDAENFRHILTNFGDKLNEEEMEEIWDEFDFDDDKNVLTKSVVDMFVPGAMDEKEEEEEKKEEAKEAAPSADDGGQKKKKKKKKAAK